MNATRRHTSLILAAALLACGGTMLAGAEAGGSSSNAPGTNGTPAVGLGTNGTPTTAAAVRIDFAGFKVIAEHNIFNGSRSGQRLTASRGGSLRRTARVETFTLVGTLISEKGPVAFFDGSTSEYRKALKPGASLAGFQIRDILPNGARIEAGTNILALRVGTAMRREDGGPWRRSTDGAAFAAAKGEATAPAEVVEGEVAPENIPAEGNTAPAGEMSDVLKRLMEKRQKEDQ